MEKHSIPVYLSPEERYAAAAESRQDAHLAQQALLGNGTKRKFEAKSDDEPNNG